MLVKVILFLAAVLLAMTQVAGAMLIVAPATGDQMAGGTLTVNFLNAGPVLAPIVAAPAQTGTATAPGMFTFSVSGDTFNNIWNLQNLTTSDMILSANFNLAGSISLFDNNSLPSTPNSALGRLGAVWVAGPGIIASGELVPWPDIQNKGDMFLQENISWAGFNPGLLANWEDDTDVVPEPATLLLLGSGLAGLIGFGRKRLFRKT